MKSSICSLFLGLMLLGIDLKLVNAQSLSDIQTKCDEAVCFKGPFCFGVLGKDKPVNEDKIEDPKNDACFKKPSSANCGEKPWVSVSFIEHKKKFRIVIIKKNGFAAWGIVEKSGDGPRHGVACVKDGVRLLTNGQITGEARDAGIEGKVTPGETMLCEFTLDAVKFRTKTGQDLVKSDGHMFGFYGSTNDNDLTSGEVTSTSTRLKFFSTIGKDEGDGKNDGVKLGVGLISIIVSLISLLMLY